MKLSEYQFVRLTPDDKASLLEIASREDRNPSDVIRRLIRNAARELDLRTGLALAQPIMEKRDGKAN